MAELIKEQEELQKKVKEAGQIGDKAKREEELKRLARQQEELRKKTEEMVRQLTRMRAPRAGQTLGRAGEQMEGAEQQMAGRTAGRGRTGRDARTAQRGEARIATRRKEAEEELGPRTDQPPRRSDPSLKERQEALNARDEPLSGECPATRGSGTEGFENDFQRKRRRPERTGGRNGGSAGNELSSAPVFARSDAPRQRGDDGSEQTHDPSSRSGAKRTP